MNNLTKEDTKRFIIESLNNNDYDENNLNSFMNDLYNISNEEIYPLSQNETFILRKRLGVLDSGKVIKKIEIAKILNVTPTTVDNILKKALIKVIKYLELNKTNVKKSKMTSLDNLENKDDFKDILLLSLNFDTTLINRLAKKNINTINDLLGYSITEIEKMFGPIVAYKLSDKMAEMGLSFLDRLSPTEKLDIVSKSSIETINNSSIYWLFDVQNTSKSLINYIRTDNIKEYLEILETLPMESKRKILNSILPVRYIIMDKKNENNSNKNK